MDVGGRIADQAAHGFQICTGAADGHAGCIDVAHRQLAVARCSIGPHLPGQRAYMHAVGTGDAAANQAHIANGGQISLAKEPDVITRGVNSQAGNRVAQAIEVAGEGGGGISHRGKAGCHAVGHVPGVGVGGGDVGAQGIAARGCALHALQVGAGGAAGRAQAVEHGVAGAADAQDAGAAAGAKIDAPQKATWAQAHFQGAVVDRRIRAVGGARVERQHGAAAGGHDGIDLDVLGRRHGECVGAPGHRVVDIDIARTGARRARTGEDAHIAARQGCRERGAGNVAAGRTTADGTAIDRADDEITRVDQPTARLATRCAGIDTCAIRDTDVRARRINKAAITAKAASAGADAAGYVGLAVGVGKIGYHRDGAAPACAVAGGVGDDAAALHNAVRSHQADPAAVLNQAGSVQLTAIAHHTAVQAVGGLGGKNDQPAGCLHRLAVLDQRGDGGGLDQDIGQTAAATELQFIRFPGRQCHRPLPRNDYALVAHGRCQQGDIACQSGLELALVEDAAAGAVARKNVAPDHEIAVADAVRGSHQAPHIHTGSRGEIDPVGVAQKHLAIGADTAKDLARIAVQHPIQRDAAGGGLHKRQLRLRSQIEALPVDGSTIAALADGHAGMALTDAGATGNHLAADRQLGCGGRRSQCGIERQRDDHGGHQTLHFCGAHAIPRPCFQARFASDRIEAPPAVPPAYELSEPSNLRYADRCSNHTPENTTGLALDGQPITRITSVTATTPVTLTAGPKQSGPDRAGPQSSTSSRAKDMGSAAVLLSLPLCAGVWASALYAQVLSFTSAAA